MKHCNKNAGDEKNFFLKKSLPAIFILLILCIGIGLRLHNLSINTHRSPDEIIYTAQAKTIAKHGISGFKILAKEYKREKKLWFFPPPTRVGYLFLLSSAMKISNHFDVSVGSKISTISSILSLLILILIGLRFFNAWTTLFALVFLSTSPIALNLARRTWQDALVGCLGALLIYLSCEIISNPRKKIWYVLLIILGGIGILIKATLVLFFGLCVLWILWNFIVYKKRYKESILLVCLSGISVALFTGLMIYAIGGMSNLITIWSHVKNAMPHNLFAIKYQNGPWYLMFFALSSLSAFAFYLLFFAIPILLFFDNKKHRSSILHKQKSTRILLGLLFITTTLTLIAGITPYCLNIRYISPIFVPYFLIVGTIFYRLIQMLLKNLPIKQGFFFFLLICLLAIIAFQGYYNFNNYFIKTSIHKTPNAFLIQNFYHPRNRG